MGCHDVDDAVERKGTAQLQAFNHLERSVRDWKEEGGGGNSNLSENIFPAKSRQALVPDGGKQLLDAGVGDKSLLLVRDCKLQPFEALDVPNLEQSQLDLKKRNPAEQIAKFSCLGFISFYVCPITFLTFPANLLYPVKMLIPTCCAV